MNLIQYEYKEELEEMFKDVINDKTDGDTRLVG
jgi:hypothetical protein